MGKNFVKPSDYRLAIGISDNDFWSLLTGILTTIGDSLDFNSRKYQNRPELWDSLLDPDSVRRLVASMAESHYWLYQGGGIDLGKDIPAFTRERMDCVDVHIGADFDRVLNDRRRHNGELCFLDMRLPRDQRVYTL